MKYILSLLITLLLMAGCHRPATGELCTELQRAEALMYPHPDSALHILQTMNVPGDELNRATWALFTTQAKYKLYQTQSDSLLNIALPYFLENGDAQRKALALYYRAALYNEEKKVEEAQDFYLKAADEVKKTEDYQLGYLIYAGLSDIYAHRSFYDQALEHAKTAHLYASQNTNIRQLISSYILIARVYKAKHLYQESIETYKKAIQLAEENNIEEKVNAAIGELASVYNRMKDYKSALFYIKKSFTADKAKDLTLARIYKNLNQPDSAIFYFKEALSASNVYTRTSANLALYYLLKDKKKFEEADFHLEKAWILHDSTLRIDKSRILIEMQEKYDQQKVKDEAAMEIRLQKQRTLIYIGSIIVVVLLAGVYARHRYRRRIARLAEAEDRIDTLTRMLEEAQEATGEDDAFVKRILLQQLGVIRLVANTPTAQNQALLRRLAEIGNDQVPVEELIVWKDLYPLIDRLYNGFHSRLTERFGSILTNKEVQICCLLCAGFSTKEISVITHQSSGIVYVRKTSIRKKLGIEEAADIVEAVKAFDDTH